MVTQVPAIMAAKVTTGLARLAVAKHPHATLKHYYERTLTVLSKMPQDAAYRVNTEAIVKSRMAIVDQEKDIAKVEEKIGAGQVEEIILQASRELGLARKMLSWKPWEPLLEAPPKDQWKWPA